MQYPYLNDNNFLKALDEENYKEYYIRITILNFSTEEEIASIEGKSTGGSCNLNGTSSMRRTASCTIVVDPDGIYANGRQVQYYNITDVDNLISMNKKVKIDIGLLNPFFKNQYYIVYNDYEIIWFPLGTYVIKSANVSKGTGGINISLTLNDKCALINGDMGGTIPAGTIFSEEEIFNATGTSREVRKILIKDIIRNLMIEFGGERAENILISDIPETIPRVIKWVGKNPLYFYEKEGSKQFVLEKPSEEGAYTTYGYGQDIGYTNEPFVYPGTLECNAGESVASVLDKIKNVLGNFEWFYDVFGRFHFQEIKNFLNNSPTTDFTKMNEQDYLSITNYFKPVYTFDKSNQKLITSISNNPQYPNVKNDYIVWGVTKTTSGADKPIRYHLAFDTRPIPSGTNRLALVYKDYRNLNQIIFLMENENFEIVTNLVGINDKSKYYLIKNQEETKFQILHWDNEIENYRTYSDWNLCYLTTDDWRTELYFQGIEARNKTFSNNYYAAELNAEWPKIYDVMGILNDTPGTLSDIPIPIYKGKYRKDFNPNDSRYLGPENYEYWLDFLEGSTIGDKSIAQFNVNNIGRRSKVVTDNNSNCIFPVEVPNYFLIENGLPNTEEKRLEAENKGQTYIQVDSNIFKYFATGGTQNAAYDKIKELLYTHTGYNESVNLSIIPIYYLEPNTRIRIEDQDTNINGEYLIKSISLPLTANGTSSISATKCLERTF